MATGITKSKGGASSAAKTSRTTGLLDCQVSGNAGIELTYPGKLRAEEVLIPIESIYSQVGNESALPAKKISANALLFSDNYLALHKLIAQRQKVDLIYLDPPFATGMDFQSRKLAHAYEDRFTPVVYVEFMRRRLILMRELLTQEGSIYIHIGHQMLFHLKMVMDEVFGPANFRNLIVRRKCSSKNSTTKQYPNLNDYILFYSKGKGYKWNQPKEPASAEWIAREYSKADERGKYKLVPIHAPGVRNGQTGEPWKDMLPPPGKHWQYTPDKLDELDKNNEIHWSRNGNPRRKVYLTEEKALPLTDYWDGFRDAHHQSIAITGYPTEKNLALLKVIVGASSEPGDVVLDPFCGSGTTLHAANDLDRKWIGIDESITALEASVDRLRNGLNKMGDYVNSQPQLVAKRPAHQSAKFSLFAEADLYSQFKKEIREIQKL